MKENNRGTQSELNESEKEALVQSNISLLKQLSSRITFGIGALIGGCIAYFFGHTIAVGVLFGGAMSLAVTTCIAPNKSKKERWLLGGAMMLFVLIAFIGYLLYRG